MDCTTPNLLPNPSAKANPISKLFLIWIIPLFRKGYKNVLETEHLFDTLKDDDTEYLANKLERYWKNELHRAKYAGTKPSFTRALVKFTWKPFAVLTFFYVINQCVIVVSQPIFLRLLINTFSEDSSEPWRGYMYAGFLGASVFLNTVTLHPIVFKLIHLGMKLRVAVSSLIYRKSLGLSNAAISQTSSGQIINLLSNDCTRLEININFLPFIIIAPILLVTLIYLLAEEIGLAYLASVVFVILLLPMQYYIGKYSAIFRVEIAKQTDTRGGLMNEIILGMKVIKQYAWEMPFSTLIHNVRRLEVIPLQKRGHLRGLHQALVNFAPKLLQYITFVAFLLMYDEHLTSAKAFFTFSCLHTMCQITIHFTPQAAAGVGEMMVAIRRIQKFLLLDDKQAHREIHFTCESSVLVKESESEKFNARILMENVNATWDGEKSCLDNVSFTLEKGNLLMIVGPVGSSKTSLLHALLHELPITSGSLSVSGLTSYASQEPWIFSGNIRQNILFNLPFDESRYAETIRASALEGDLKQIPYGDLTPVVYLSGGQKARVNLARAIYKEADIYLLDDPLSAVDPKVSRHLFEQCIKGHLRGTTRILVTHQLQFLDQADHIIILHEGKIHAQGKFYDLLQMKIDFVGIIHSNEEAIAAKRASIISLNREAIQLQRKESILTDSKPLENIENKNIGSVDAKTYWKYFTSGHRAITAIALLGTFILCQILLSANDWWLSFWTNAEARRIDADGINATNSCENNNGTCDDTSYLGENVYLFTYTGLTVAVVLTNLLCALWFYLYCTKISITLHNSMFQGVVRASMKFFDDNPSGRIMNRFTKDVGIIDELLPPALIGTVVIFLQVIGVVCVVIISNYYMTLPTVVLFIVLYFMRSVFVETASDIKRIESITRSPVFTHVVATLQGLTTIRASKAENILVQQFEGHQNVHSAAWYLFIAANRCFGMWLELFSDFYLIVITFSFFLIPDSSGGGNVGLAISSVLSLMGAFQWGMRQSAETENYMISTERALEYSTLPPEEELDSQLDLKPPPSWPTLGQIKFVNLSLSYEKDRPILRNLNFEIKPSEKIGIVGRTGAGKSSLISALFRLAELEGDIIIDGIKTNEIGLHDLRKKISIIPQDPILFSGSVRYNLDPFEQFTDSELWNVIQDLKESIPSLDFQVADGGANLSVGQRQLICLARAILKQNKILVLDEFTSSVDFLTEEFIQKIIRSKFADYTIITIAHRLHSVIDCDKVLVLDHGILVEYDHPHILLQDDVGIFTKMLSQLGPTNCSKLIQQAREAYMSKTSGSHSQQRRVGE